MVRESNAILTAGYLLLLFSFVVRAHNVHPLREDSGKSHDVIGLNETPKTHSCIHDEILESRKSRGIPEYTVSAQQYDPSLAEVESRRIGSRNLLSTDKDSSVNKRQPIRIFLNYDAVGHSPERDCRAVGDIVKLGEPPQGLDTRSPICNSQGDLPVFGDCWYSCTQEDIAEGDKSRRLRAALGETAEWFKNALSVDPVRGPLRLSGYSACGQDGGVQLPRQYVDEGVMGTDLVLLVTTRPTMGGTLAWAVACERDQWGRAVAGHVNVAPRHLTAEAETLLSATLIHEVMHVLGFDPHAFSHFRDERKLRRSSVVQQNFDEELGRNVTRVTLPRVVMQARHHFGAYSRDFEGLELEDGGGRGTAGSHWEKRLLMNEIMTGSVDVRSVVSRMTLALLEDSGWYSANESAAGDLTWGRGQGIDFVTKRCDQWGGSYRCNGTRSSGCTYNREAEGYCPITRYNGDLPTWAQYFSETNKGGQSSLADYCAYFVQYSDGSCVDASSSRSADKMLGEERGPLSRCMTSTLVKTGFVRGTSVQGSGCYQHRCRENYMEVAVDGIWQQCPPEGGPTEFLGFNGELECPPFHELCSGETPHLPGNCLNKCSGNGGCLEGSCTCFLGFTGEDCSQRICPSNCTGRGECLASGICECDFGYTGIDCSTAGCDEQCSLHGGVCDNGVCEFRCSDYAGYSCQSSDTLSPSLNFCAEVFGAQGQGGGSGSGSWSWRGGWRESWGGSRKASVSGNGNGERGGRGILERETGSRGSSSSPPVLHCAPTEPAILQQLEGAVVGPNYNRLVPLGRSLLTLMDTGQCALAARQLSCWISIQRCDSDGDNRLRVCHSACVSYNRACGARLDCSDRTLFSGSDEEGEGACTGSGIFQSWVQTHVRPLALLGLVITTFWVFVAGLYHFLGGWVAAVRELFRFSVPTLVGVRGRGNCDSVGGKVSLSKAGEGGGLRVGAVGGGGGEEGLGGGGGGGGVGVGGGRGVGVGGGRGEGGEGGSGGGRWLRNPNKSIFLTPLVISSESEPVLSNQNTPSRSFDRLSLKNEPRGDVFFTPRSSSPSPGFYIPSPGKQPTPKDVKRVEGLFSPSPTNSSLKQQPLTPQIPFVFSWGTNPLISEARSFKSPSGHRSFTSFQKTLVLKEPLIR